MQRIWAVIVALLIGATTSLAHYNMLLPDKPWAQKDEKVVFTYQFGHPFEHELFDAPKPASLLVHLPSGKLDTLDVDKALTKIEVPGADGKKVVAWRFDYTPAERGDHVFLMKTARIKHDEGKFLEDTVKVVLHVQTQNGWDWDAKKIGFESGLDILPYTRPYGLRAGMVFRGKVVVFPQTKANLGQSDPRSSNRRIEIEKYNSKPSENLPPNELITFQTKTDRDGFFVTTLPDPGWWGITALAGTNKDAPEVTRRTTLWVHVDEKK